MNRFLDTTLDFIETLDVRSLGGPGSGNFGHAGRPGEVGGSAPSGDYQPKREPEYYGKAVGGVSQQAHQFITDWQDSPTAVPTAGVIEELRKYRPKESVYLYRGTGKSGAALRSWTYSREVAEGFVEPGERVIGRRWYPNEILLDFTRLPKEYRDDLDEHGKGSALQEVIVRYRNRALGGPGSGNFGHAGRPGEVGGSAGSGGFKSTAQGVNTKTESASAALRAKTGQPFEAMLYRGTETDNPYNRIPSQFAVGEYRTPFPEIAATYGRVVKESPTRLENPYVLTLGERAYFDELRREFGTNDPDRITQQLLEKGHDGLIVKNVPANRGEVAMRDSIEVIVFKEGKR